MLIRSSTGAQSPDMALWCLPGFADSSSSFLPLFQTVLADHIEIYCIDLPGFGASPRGDHACNIVGYVDTLLDLIDAETTGRSIGLVGHSVGSVLAVEAAKRLGDRCRGVFSLEGNLVEEDAYFSGQAADFDDPLEFKEMFAAKIWDRGAADLIFRQYHSGVVQADPEAMWFFGRDVKAYSRDNRPGYELLSLECPTCYFWCAENTPAATQHFLHDRELSNVEVEGTSHWPMLDQPALVAEAIMKFFGG